PDSSANPTISILVLLAVAVGMPYFVLSATGPLMQQWFSLSRPGLSPYPLFALSNAGSLTALAAYSFLMEPLLPRKTHALVWSASLIMFALFAAACGWILWRTQTTQPVAGATETETGPGPTFGRKLFWLLLSGSASGLMLAITNKLCLDLTVM